MATEAQTEKGASVPRIKISQDKYADHVVVITGCGSGIGEATARLFAQQGAQVVMLDVDGERLEAVQASIQAAGHQTDTQVCDVSSEQSVSAALEATVQKHGKIDALINAAGIYPFHALVGCPTDVYRRTMAVNLDGAFHLTRAVLPYMQRAGYGRIVHTSSASFGDPQPGMASYVASKGGVIGLVRAAAVEAGPGITVNAVLPGLIETAGVLAHQGSSELFDLVVSKQLVQRRGHPLDVAHVFSFVASPEAAFCTGQIFDCGGGITFY